MLTYGTRLERGSRLGILLACLVAALEPLSATQYYVRSDGNDSLCNGTLNAPSTQGAPNCAFATPARALNQAPQGAYPSYFVHNNTGDDLQIGAGTWPQLLIPENFKGLDTDGIVIAGDPSISRLQIKIAAAGSEEEAVFSAAGSGNKSTQYLTLKHMSITAGTKHGIYLSGRHQYVSLTDLESVPGDFPLITGRTSGDNSSAVIRVGKSTDTNSSHIVLSNSRFIGGSHR